MDASKENCQKALRGLIDITNALPERERTALSDKFLQVKMFLLAAKAKLPSQASFDRRRRSAASMRKLKEG